VRHEEREARAEQGYAADARLERIAQAAVKRAALSRVLVSWGLLLVTSNPTAAKN
jgi:hypothetical protein